MNGVSPVKHGLVDLSAVLFVIGGVVSLLMTLLTIPVSSIYPNFTLPSSLNLSSLVVLGISLISSLGAIHCYSLARKRLLSEAGIRGIIFGALLLIFSLGIVGSLRASDTSSSLTAISGALVLIGGAVCFGLRHTMISASEIARQQNIAQPQFHP
jgi:hypothetical protein